MRGSTSSILSECRELCATRVADAAARLLDAVPSMLSERAQKEPENDQKNIYFRARDEARTRGALLTDDFGQGVAAAFAKLSKAHAKRSDAKNHGPKNSQKVSARELTLVDHEDLSESLKVRDLIRRLTGAASEQLTQLQPRIALLANLPDLTDEDNPLSPHTLCNAFRAACEKFDADVRVRMVVLEAFETSGIGDLEKLYRDLNILLVERDVIPVASFRVQKSTTVPESLLGPGQAGASGARASGGGGGAASSPDLFAILQGLMSNLAARGPAVPALPMYAAPAGNAAASMNLGALPSLNFDLLASAPVVLEGAQLMNALTRFQHNDFAAAQSDALQARRAADANLLHEIRQSPLGRGLGVPDAGTLDIVACIFDQIFADEKIPPAMKALIGRLQFPLLKVALLDKSFFADTQHPARAMLDVLSEFTLDTSLAADSVLYGRLEQLIESLLADFDADLQVFEALLRELRELLQQQTWRAEERSRQAVDAAQRKESRRVARQRAYSELKSRASGRSLPKVVLKFLMEEWLKLLYLAYCNKGEDSPAWNNALHTLDELIWSLEPKQSADERRQLAAKLPRLLKQLRAGMRAAGTETSSEQVFLGALMRRHTALIEGSAPAKTTKPAEADSVQDTQSVIPGAARGDSAAEHDERAPIAVEPPPVLDADASASERSAASEDEAGAQAIVYPSSVPESDELVELDFTTLADKDDAPARDFKPAFAVEEIEIEAAQLPDNADEVTSATYSAADLRLGCWVDIEQADASRVSAKLSFISPSGGVYLFTDSAGAQVAEMRFIDVARAIRSGAVKPIERVSIFDRAVAGLISALRAQ